MSSWKHLDILSPLEGVVKLLFVYVLYCVTWNFLVITQENQRNMVELYIFIYFFWCFSSVLSYTLSRLCLWMFPIIYRYFSGIIIMGTKALNFGQLKLDGIQIEISVLQWPTQCHIGKPGVGVERRRFWYWLWNCNRFSWACPWPPLGLGLLTFRRKVCLGELLCSFPDNVLYGICSAADICL